MNATLNNFLNTTEENLQMTTPMYTPWALDELSLIVKRVSMVIKILQLLFATITNIITVLVICKTDKLRTAGNQLVIGQAIADALMFLCE